MPLIPSRNPRFALMPILAATLVVPAIAPIKEPVSFLKPNPRAHGPIQIRNQRDDGSVGSSNWGGYAVLGKDVTDARGSWIVPPVDCSENANNHFAAFWTGIDGYSSNTVEQTGTDSDCVKGKPTYFAWFEFFPNPSFNVVDFPVNPGDSINAEVSYDGTSDLFTVHLRNATSGQSFKISSAVPNAKRNSAEWIAEAPATASRILPLSHFGSVFFGHNYTGVSKTGFATVNGTTGAIGTFGKVSEITMVKKDGTTIKALPSPLSSDGSSFVVTRE